MTPSQLYTRFRSDVVDAVEPFLWSRDEVWDYMVDAQRMLCRLTDGIRDASSAAAQAVITTGDPWVDIDPAVLKIRDVALDSTGYSIPILSFGAVTGAQNTSAPFPSTTELNLTGDVTAVITDMEEGKLRCNRIPAADDLLNMVIERLPLEDPSGTGPFEVRAEHHLHLLLWMKHLAYAKQDTETFDKGKSDDFGARFEAYCKQAKLEKDRRNRTPRLMTYGGL